MKTIIAVTLGALAALTLAGCASSYDKETQKAAFRFGNNKTTVIETGAYNLTQDVASCFIRFGAGPPQTWLIVRLPAPTMPNTPTRLSEQPKPLEGSG